MTKCKCDCGEIYFLNEYTIVLEGTLTIREYKKQCNRCGSYISVKDIKPEDLLEQYYLC